MAAAALLSSEDLQERVAALVAENQRLRDELDAIKAEKIGGGFLAPIEWGLTGKEEAIFGILMSRDICSKESIHFAVYHHLGGEGPDLKIVDVFVCKMRPKVEPYGILIETRWGHGYFMPESSKAIARELIAASPTVGQAA